MSEEVNKEETKDAKQVDRDELSEDQLQDASGGGEFVDPRGSSQCYDSAQTVMTEPEFLRCWPRIGPGTGKDDGYR
jgi:hypothetical protein